MKSHRIVRFISCKTIRDKTNLSNTPKSETQDAQIAASGSNVYVTWWERNQTVNEPVMKVSNVLAKHLDKR